MTTQLIQSAIEYCELGWHVLPVAGKVPIGGNLWQDKTTNDPTKAESLLSGCDSVGVQLGSKSGIVDIECDSDSAYDSLLDLLDGEIPEGPHFQSARGKHFIFRWSDRFPNKAVFKINGVEFRIGSNKACQSVFPPSGSRQWIVHPHDKPIGDFPALDKVIELYEKQNKRKVFPSIPHGPKYGDSDTLDVPKWLKKHGCEIIGTDSKEGVTRWFIECPGVESHSNKNAWRDCCVTQEMTGKLGGHCFHQSCGIDSWESIKTAIGVLGHDDFSEPIDEMDISEFMVGKVNVKTWGAKLPAPPVDCDPFPIPKMLYGAKGIIELFVDYAISTAPRPRPELALANAISMIGVITGRKIRNKSGLRTNIYMIGLAESGSGKDWSRKCCREIFSVACMQDYLAAENPASGAALVTAIHEHPSSLFQIDEINRYFASIKNSGGRNPFLNEVFDILMKLNDQCSNPAWSPKGYGESKKNKVVAYPHCCIFGTGTPDGFWVSVKSSDATDGFLARMIVIEAPSKHPRKIDAESKEPPREIIERITDWNNWYGGSGNLASAIPQTTIIPIDSAAKDRLWSHSEGIEDRIQDETKEQRTIWSRTAATAEKLAMIFACSRGPSELIVRLEDAERAVALANWTTRLLVRRVFSSVSENEEESKRKRVYAIIAEGPIKLNALTRRTQWLRGSRERKDVLDDLLEAELIEMAWDDAGKGKTGKIGAWYRQLPTLTID